MTRRWPWRGVLPAPSILALFSSLPCALAQAPTSPFDAALSAEARGDTGEARRLYQQIVEETPDHGRAWINLGLLEIRRGRATTGLAHCQRALELAPDAAKVHYCLGLAKKRSDPDAAAAAFERSIALLDDQPEPKVELAHLRRKAKRYEDAVELYRDAVRKRPDDPDLHVHLGYCYKKLGQLVPARIEYEKAVQKDPTSFYGHLDLGWVLAKTKDDAGAARHYREAARLDPEHPDPHYNLGNLYRRMGEPSKAADAYAAAVERAPDDVPAQFALARAAWRAHRPAVAKAAVDHLAKMSLGPKKQAALEKLRALLKRTPPALPEAEKR